MVDEPWLTNFEAEIQQAESARARGNEGMARVCARRAAGWVVGEYFRRRDIRFHSPSVYERMQVLLQMPGVDNEIKEVAGHFLVRVTPEHDLPLDADLIAEARWLKSALLGSGLR